MCGSSRHNYKASGASLEAPVFPPLSADLPDKSLNVVKGNEVT